ncbi:MAG: hypothetical protein UX58_C0005G0044 [Candidatus Wolfebacteria bacterium GW2011_GWB2_46_69]|nr:MAG: hypothetical protein UX58_C0005G0044 [Candidatus Wolfebacteria bacterium GW2011_GWB2_46_69]
MNKKAFIGLLTFVLGMMAVSHAHAGTATLTWNANNESDLSGYKVYYDTTSHSGNCPSGFGLNVVSVGNVTTHTFNNLTDGQTYYFQVTAIDTSSNESTCSAQVSKVIAATDTTTPITTASPLGGSYASAQTVTMSVNETATVYYTLDGSTPTIASTQYTGPISITSTKTLKYFAKDTAGNSEAVKTQAYTITIPDTTAPITTASPLGGSYASAQTVTMSVNETATVYYTLDGTTPTVASTQYTGPVSITSTKTLKYFAKDTAGNSEAIKSQTYVITIVSSDTTVPSVPENLTATPIAPTLINLAWSASTDDVGVTHYKVYRHDVEIATVTGLAYSDEGLSLSTVYRYRIAAVDAALNTSARSNEVSATTSALPVAASGGGSSSGGGGGGGGSSASVTQSQPTTPVLSGTTQQATTTATPVVTVITTGSQQGTTVTAGSGGGQYSQFGAYVTRKHLVYGSRGEDVKKLQEFLRVDGYLKESATGYYGKATQAAIQKFQQAFSHESAFKWIGSGGRNGYRYTGVVKKADRAFAAKSHRATQAVG